MKTHQLVTTIKSLGVVLCLMALVVPSNSHALNQSQTAWADYADAKQWFKIAYLSAYQVTSPTNKPGSYGGVHTFSSGRQSGQAGVQIVVGLHTTQRDSGESLEAWAVHQLFASSMFTSEQLHYLTRTVALDKLNSQNTAARADEQRVMAVILEGSSPASPEWKSTYIPYGNVVFFMWTNSRKPADALVYDRMVDSLRFTAKTPRTLQVAYGIVPTKTLQPTSLPGIASHCLALFAREGDLFGMGDHPSSTKITLGWWTQDSELIVSGLSPATNVYEMLLVNIADGTFKTLASNATLIAAVPACPSQK